MTVFQHAFYGKESFWLHATRRGQYFEIDTTRSFSKTLYGQVLRAVASQRGEPGSRWPLYQVYKHSLQPAAHGAQAHHKQTSLAIASPLSKRGLESTKDDHLRYTHLRYNPKAGEVSASRAPMAPSGYQHRGAHGGSQRGWRSEEARTRRYDLWQARRRANRQDYRQWKSHQQDVALKVHGNNSPPPIHLKPTSQHRLQRSLKSAQKHSTVAVVNQTRSTNKHVSLPLPTGTPLNISTWNVEGLKEVAKYDMILSFCKTHKISLLCAQETKADSSYTFQKSGWEILLSGTPKDIHHGVGFFVSPALRSHARDFKPHSSRICELTLDTLPHPITIINIYAPSTIDPPEPDRTRKAHFWEDLEDLWIYY